MDDLLTTAIKRIESRELLIRGLHSSSPLTKNISIMMMSYPVCISINRDTAEPWYKFLTNRATLVHLNQDCGE